MTFKKRQVFQIDSPPFINLLLHIFHSFALPHKFFFFPGKYQLNLRGIIWEHLFERDYLRLFESMHFTPRCCNI